MATKDQLYEKRMMCFLTDAESESVIRSIPFNDYGLIVDIQRGGVNFAIEYIKENRSPEILLIDLSQEIFPVASVVNLAEVCEPSVEVIAIGERNDVGIFRDLIRAGIRDYLVKPLPLESLVNVISQISRKEEVIDEQAFHKTGKILSVIGASGGAGVSTVVSNLGWVLAERESKYICLIDVDLQLGTLSQFLDVPTTTGLKELFDAPERFDSTLIDRFLVQYSQNLNMLSSQISLNEASFYKPDAVDIILKILSSRFHYVMIDLPRNFTTDMNRDILKKSNTIIIVTDYSISSLKNINYILEMLKLLSATKQEILIVANKIGQYSAGELTREQFEETLEREIFMEIPFDRLYPMQALRDGTPVMEKNSGSLATGINILADHLKGMRKKIQQQNNLLNYFFKRN